MESYIAEFLLRQVACEHLPTPLSKTRGAAARGPPSRLREKLTTLKIHVLPTQIF